MLRKKLLTIACVVGILGCGACFLPPVNSTPHYPPPPPIREELRGIKAIRVFVDDASGAHTVDTSEVASCVAGNLDERAGQTHIKNEDRKTPRPGDAVLQITLQKVTTTQNPPAQQENERRWSLELTIDATLTGANGETLWEQKSQSYRDDGYFQSNDPVKIWKDSGVSLWLSGRFSDRLLGAMFYGD
jgi:hypothetical protein